MVFVPMEHPVPLLSTKVGHRTEGVLDILWDCNTYLTVSLDFVIINFKLPLTIEANFKT